MNRDVIEIVKVPLPKNPIYPQQSFPAMPIMYLELLENKNKVKKNCVNQDYVGSLNSPSTNVTDAAPPLVEKYSSTYSPAVSATSPPINNPLQNANKEMKTYNDNIISPDKEPLPIIESAEISPDNKKEKEDEIPVESEVTKKLFNMLKKDTTKEPFQPTVKTTQSAVQPQPTVNIQPQSNSNFEQLPPKLSELQNGQYKDVVGIEKVSDAELDDKKRELLFKYGMLSQKYKNANLPEYSIHTDYETLNKTYESTVHKLAIESSADSYKKWLITGFMIMEWLGSKVLKFDMSGYMSQQMLAISSYEILLIELGEKNYVPTGSRMPVELRLFLMVLGNTAFFLITKYIANQTGFNVIGLMNSINGINTQQAPVQTKKKMNGPNIDMNSL